MMSGGQKGLRLAVEMLDGLITNADEVSSGEASRKGKSNALR